MKPDYQTAHAWDVIWSRPYYNYERHHQLFWKLIRQKSYGRVCDLGCGSASCWRGCNPGVLVGVDFSYEACRQAAQNCPHGTFVVSDVCDTPLESHFFDIVVCSGVVNYYRDLTRLKQEILRLLKKGGLSLLTINVINDFPDRTWTPERIHEEFDQLGTVDSAFYEKIGFFIAIQN